MQKKHIGWYVLVLLLLAVTVLPTPASAFWPFSVNKGRVMGVESESGNANGLLQKINSLRTGDKKSTSENSNLNPEGLVNMANPKARLEQAVKAGKITQDQANEILTRLSAIKAKQQELMTLQKSLVEWLKANNLSTAMMNESTEVKREVTGTPKPLLKRPTGVSTEYLKRGEGVR